MFKFKGRLDLCTSRFLIPLYCISCHIGDNVSFKFGGVDKHSVCLFVYLLVLFYLLFCLFLSVYKNFSFCLLLCCYLGTTYIVTVDCMSLVCLTCLNTTYH
jgi:hypothetical protein